MQAAPVTTYPLPTNIQVTVLFHFLAKIESEGLRGLANSGFRREQIDTLRYLSTSDFIQLVNENRPLVHAWGDAANLDFALKRLSSNRAETELQTEFIRRGASAAMMYQLFRVSPKFVALQRSLLCLDVKQGRPKSPDEETQSTIYAAWKSLSNPSVRQRYLDLDDMFPDIPFSVLFAATTES
ncbi:MAG: STY4526/YPO1902 family pathogenicity island replication protein [Sulfuricellaceae bacterium]